MAFTPEYWQAECNKARLRVLELEGKMDKVAAEAVVHQAVCDLVQRMADEWGIRISRASIRWLEARSITEPNKGLIDSIELETTYKP